MAAAQCRPVGAEGNRDGSAVIPQLTHHVVVTDRASARASLASAGKNCGGAQPYSRYVGAELAELCLPVNLSDVSTCLIGAQVSRYLSPIQVRLKLHCVRYQALHHPIVGHSQPSRLPAMDKIPLNYEASEGDTHKQLTHTLPQEVVQCLENARFVCSTPPPRFTCDCLSSDRRLLLLSG